MLFKDGSSLCYTYDSEQIRISPWGPDALRIRATKHHTFPTEDWALGSPPVESHLAVSIHEDHATIKNGSITASISR